MIPQLGVLNTYQLVFLLQFRNFPLHFPLNKKAIASTPEQRCDHHNNADYKGENLPSACE